MIYDVAIVGAGPSGISTAIEAKLLGLNVILFEKESATNNTLRKFYKDGKRVDKDYKGQIVDLRGSIEFSDSNKEDTIALFEKLLEKHGIEPAFKKSIEKVEKNGELFTLTTSGNESFQAHFVVIAVGKMGQPNKPDYKIPSSLLRKVVYNVNSIAPDEKVLVVGGGNSAAEYAIALSESNNTTITHRRESFTSINEINARDLESAKAKGLKIILNVSINELSDNEGKPQVHFSDGSTATFDKVVYAIGGSVPLEFLKKCGVALNDSNLPIVDNFESSIPNVFVIGDILYKSGASVATGLNQGLDVAKIIKSRL